MPFKWLGNNMAEQAETLPRQGNPDPGLAVGERAAFGGAARVSFLDGPGRRPLASPRRLEPPSLRHWIARQLAEEARYGHGFLWMPVAMAAGAALDLSAPRDIALPALVVPLAVLILLAWATRAKGWRGAPFLVAAAALFAGLTAASVQVRMEATTILDGPVVTRLTGVVLSREPAGKSGWRYLVELTSTSHPVIRRPPERVHLVARGRQVPVEPGQGISGLARLLPPSGPALPGGYDFGFNSFFQHVGAIGFFYGPPHAADVPLAAGRSGIAGFTNAVAQLRQGIDSRIRAVLPGDAGALAAALIVADRGAIPKPVVQALRDAGLAHILAISGLHMVLVSGTVFLVLRLLLGLSQTAAERLPAKKIAAVAALVVATAYLVLSGVAVSTLRAWIMLAIMLFAALLDRPALTLRNVAIAAAAIILANPAAVLGPSFQMSFAATMALIAGYSALSRSRLGRGRETAGARPFRFVLKSLGAIVFTSLVAGSATGIFAAYHFQQVATLGAVGNLLAMPLISFLVMPMGLLGTLLMPYGLEAWPLKLMGTALDAVISIAFRVQALGGTEMTGRVPATVLVVFVAGFTMLVLLRSRLRRVGLVVIAASLLLDVSLLAPRRPDILIAEDGVLVGLPAQNGIATNRKRPPSFVFDQWLAALAGKRAVPPGQMPLAPGERPAKRKKGAAATPATPGGIAAMGAALQRRATGFLCYGGKWCAASVAGGLRLVTVADLAYLGTACDLAKIVVVSRPVRMSRCRNGTLLFTARTLRRSGSIEILVDRIPRPPGKPPPADRFTSSAHDPPRDAATAYRLTITSALGGVVRPWTVQRYYDWHDRSFDFGAAGPGTRTLVVPAD